MSAEIRRYVHAHNFPNGNVHRHFHARVVGHPKPVSEAHPGISTGGYYFLCVDREPHRAQSDAITQARKASR